MATLLPVVKLQFLDNNGVAAANGQLFTYAAGTTTPLAAYTDQSEATPLSNPVILDSNGMATVWLGELSYKLVLEDSLGNPLWTVDNVASIFDGSVTTTKIADHAVTTLKIAAGALSTDTTGQAIMAAAYVKTSHIADQQVTAAKIASAAITPTQCQAGIGFVPTGGCIPFFGTTLPTGFLWCDGTSYLRTAHSALFSAIGVACGTADSTHFNVPDLRGRFMRGADAFPAGSAAGNDPDYGGRTAMNAGGNTGTSTNAVGSIQADQFLSHTHTDSGAVNPGNNATSGTQVAGFGTSGSITASGGNETRPKNAACYWIIKT